MTETGPASGKPYLLGTDPEEGRRLETQHRLWSQEAHGLWDRAGFGQSDRLLDLGCGPGFALSSWRTGSVPADTCSPWTSRGASSKRWSRESARRGLAQLAARVERVEALQLEPGSHDGAFARWLFCFLPDPAPVIERVVFGLRQGGRSWSGIT